MGYLVILVLYNFIKGDALPDRGPVRIIHWAGAVPTLSSLPVIVFAFTCHQNVGPFFCASGQASNRTADVFDPE